MPLDELVRVGTALTSVPANFNVHKTVKRFLDNRLAAIESGEGIDWATGEALAFGTLVVEGHPVRLSGQDSERGTFTQRHSVLNDQANGEAYTPFNNLAPDQQRYEVINSMLSEEAVLGFEYGYSLAEPTHAHRCGKHSSAISPTARRSWSTSSSRRASANGSACRGS